MEVSKIKNLRKSGLNAFKLKPDDELVSVGLALPQVDVSLKNVIKLEENKKNPGRAVSYDLESLYEVDSPGKWPTENPSDMNIMRKAGGRKYFSIVDPAVKVPRTHHKSKKIYQDIVLISDAGKAIRFHVEKVRPQGRIAGGVNGMKIEAKEKIVAMALASDNEDSYLLIASTKGFGKLSTMESYRPQKVPGKGSLTMKITSKNGKVADAQAIRKGKDTADSVYLLTEKAVVQEIPLDEVSVYGKVTQGSTLMKLQPGDKISAIRTVSSDNSLDKEPLNGKSAPKKSSK